MTLKFRILLAITLLGVGSLLLIYFSTEYYLSQSELQAKNEFSDILEIRSYDFIEKLTEIQKDQALKLQQEAPFRKAYKEKNTQALSDWLQQSFNRYFVTAEVIDLVDIVIFDKTLNYVTSAKKDSQHICSVIINTASQRQGSAKLKPLASLCENGKFGVLVAIGGLRVSGYLMIISNATHLLKNIEEKVSTPIRVSDINNQVFYQSQHWQNSSTENFQNISISLPDTKGEKKLVIEAYKDRTELNQQLHNTRFMILLGTLAIYSFAIAIIFFNLHRSFQPLKLLKNSAEQLMNDKYIHIEEKNLYMEFSPLVHAFNRMIDQIHMVNDDLRKSLSIAEELKEQAEFSAEKAEMANYSKTIFLANMSHELRTPMHAIMSFSNIAKKKTDDEKMLSYLENITTSGTRLTSLLNNLLDLSKLESGNVQLELSMQNVSVLFQNTLNELGSLLTEKNIKVEMQNQQPYECMLDTQLILQVLVNLLSNAIKFSPEQSIIHIAITKQNAEQSSLKREAILISVTDQGIGIPEKEIESIFDKFAQSSKTRTHAGGTGLGLPISKEIVELHCGKIWAESPPKEKAAGSTFHVELPVSQANPNFLNEKNINHAINAHTDWLKMIDYMYEHKEIPADFPKNMIENENMCSLGQWINSGHFKPTDELINTHKDFHKLAGKCVNYCEMGEFAKADEVRTNFHVISARIIEILQDLKSSKT